MIECTNCHRPYPEHGTPYRCPVCRGLYDFKEMPPFEAEKVDIALPGIWRYRSSFGLPEDTPIVSLGEGNTPVVWSEAFGQQTAFKLEFTNPTGSFKDRGTTTLISFLKGRGVNEAVEDSSGNAGASFAAYAARGDIKAHVFIPETAAGPKRQQVQAYGAEIVPVPGPRSNSADRVMKTADRGMTYASHAYLPFNLPGYATIAYEIYAQLGIAPGSFICPAGQGGLLLGAARGFNALVKAGKIPAVPRLFGVQARACAPLWAVSTYGAEGQRWVTEAPTLAEGVRVRFPLRGDVVIKEVEKSGGAFLAVDEEEILPGRDQLSIRGLYVEPTSALVWSALGQLSGQIPEPVIVILTGTGLKYINQ